MNTLQRVREPQSHFGDRKNYDFGWSFDLKLSYGRAVLIPRGKVFGSHLL